LFSAELALDPLALAPVRLATVATYSPSDSCTLPEYDLPPTVVEKLVSCISCTAALLLAPPPPPAEWLEELRAGAGVLVVEAFVVDALLAALGVDVVDEAAVERAATTGFRTCVLELPDEIAPMSMVLTPLCGNQTATFRLSTNSLPCFTSTSHKREK
jgi:hypothetical protein